MNGERAARETRSATVPGGRRRRRRGIDAVATRARAKKGGFSKTNIPGRGGASGVARAVVPAVDVESGVTASGGIRCGSVESSSSRRLVKRIDVS